MVAVYTYINTFHGATASRGKEPPYFLGFTITLRHTTVRRNPLDEWSARCKHIYVATRNTYKRQTSVPRWDSKPLQTRTLHRAVTGAADRYIPKEMMVSGANERTFSLEAKPAVINEKNFLHRARNHDSWLVLLSSSVAHSRTTSAYVPVSNDRPRFTPIQYDRKIHNYVYLNLHIFGSHTGRQKIVQQMIANIPWLNFFKNGILICLGCSQTCELFQTFKWFPTCLYGVILYCILISRHDHVLNFLSIIF